MTPKEVSNAIKAAAAAPICLGEYSGTLTTSATSLSTLIAGATAVTNSPATLAAAIGLGATFVRISVESNDARISYFGNSGTVATTGELLAKGATYPINPSDLTLIYLAAQTASATIRISIFA